MKQGKNRHSAPSKARAEDIYKLRQFAKQSRLKRLKDALFVPLLCVVFGLIVITIVFFNWDPYEDIRQSVTINGRYESIEYTSHFRGSSYSTIKLAGSDMRYTVSTMMFKYPAYEKFSANVAPGTPITLIVSDRTYAENRRVYAISVDGVPVLTTEDTAKAYEGNNYFGLGFGMFFLLLGGIPAIIILFFMKPRLVRRLQGV